ncbi:MAG: 4-phosphoerythronate dehydrogenase, partial [Planctomycetes bacterium]|nr:4-phosphoerythronate dehydrogenase [Planctomycetota bacterium]
MKIVADRNIRAASQTFARHGEWVAMDGRSISRRHVRDARALIVRTATRVDAELLSGSPVEFVGSTSIGTDHLDIAWLEKNGIRWANAPGCNADAAAQYTLAMIWLACSRLARPLSDLSAGVIGRGNVGSRVVRLLEALGVSVVANDPPLEAAGQPGLVDLGEALSQDIVCLHVPLIRSGPWPTERLLGTDELKSMKDAALLVNTARGDVVDGPALLDQLNVGRLRAALDVWPGEPRIDRALLEAVTVATPHVAGYSDDGKFNGTLMVYRAFCDWLGVNCASVPFPGEANPELRIRSGEDALTSAFQGACFDE